MLKRMLPPLLLACAQGCMSTNNCGTMAAALSKPHLSLGARATHLSIGVLYSPLFLVGDVVLWPWEVSSYSEEETADGFAWTFSSAWEDGYDSVEK